MALELADVVNRTEAFWGTLGAKCINLMKRITDAGRDFEGNPFPPYSSAYSAAKAKGGMKRQASQRVSPPDLRLSGDMMMDLKRLEVSKDGVVLGWATYGDRAQWSAEMGRAVINFNNDSNPHPAVAQALHDALAIDTEEKLKKWASKPIVYNLKL